MIYVIFHVHVTIRVVGKVTVVLSITLKTTHLDGLSRLRFPSFFIGSNLNF